MVAYQRLSQIYEIAWGSWARQYVELVGGLLLKAHVTQGRILDLGCGTGVLARELANLGHSVVGMDASPGMIEVASWRACPRARFVVQDMAEARWDHDFDLVTCTSSLADAGLAAEKVWSGFSGEPYRPGCERLICLARRRSDLVRREASRARFP